MKNVRLLFVVFVLLTTSVVFSQTLEDYVLETRGDTLVVKDYTDMGDELNSLRQIIFLDSVNVPDGRVYMLKANGYYPLVNNPTTRRNTVIVGEDNTILVNNENADSAPPLICGANWGDGSNTGGINFNHDLTVKNCNIIPASAQQDLGWSFFGGGVSNTTLTVQNCLFERTRWVFMNTGAPDLSWVIKDCYFVNMNGQPCRRNGGVLDVFAPQKSLKVENNTHIMAEGLVYKFRNHMFDEIVFNHNTFINMSNIVFLDLGSQHNMTVTNNMFINCHVQPYGPVNKDTGEEDIDQIPMGLINVYPDSTIEADDIERHFTIQNNLVYWDSRLDDIASTLTTNQVNGCDWTSQMIKMNARTQAYFDNDTEYPYMVQEGWIEAVPTFTNSEDLLTTQVDVLKAFSAATCDTSSTDVMADWRKVNIGSDYYVYSDWPIPVDLSYSDASLLTAGTDGLPLGDLNWFPDLKPDAIKSAPAKASKFALNQNYPNPFNPTTTISYSIPKSGNVTLKVFNMLGHEVATLVDDYNNANQNYRVEFDGNALSSGVYFYTMTFDNQTVSKKMVLVK
jgi:hypothetical protein